jgi:hypothetical protein
MERGRDEFPARTDCEGKPRSQKRDLGHPLIFANAKFANSKFANSKFANSKFANAEFAKVKNEALLCVPLRAPAASAFVPYRRRSR